jgi:hypothetical protein
MESGVLLNSKRDVAERADLAKDARSVAFVNEHNGLVLFGNIANRLERCHSAIHGKNAVGNDLDGRGIL